MICIIDCGTSWLKQITKYINKFGNKCQTVKIHALDNIDLNSYSGIIISGAPTLLTKSNLSKFINIFKFIKTIKFPVLGICLGHQIIGVLFRAKISIGQMIDKKEMIEIIDDKNLFAGITNMSKFREEHSEFISLPKNFVKLAKSESCENEAMKHESKDIYGVQFHPEVSGVNGEKIFRNFLNLCSL